MSMATLSFPTFMDIFDHDDRCTALALHQRRSLTLVWTATSLRYYKLGIQEPVRATLSVFVAAKGTMGETGIGGCRKDSVVLAWKVTSSIVIGRSMITSAGLCL